MALGAAERNGTRQDAGVPTGSRREFIAVFLIVFVTSLG
jgi:hypothetical protein